MTQPFCLPASTMAHTSFTSLLGSIMKRLSFISSWYAMFIPIELSPGDGNGEADRRVVFRREHLAGKNPARLGEPASVEGLEPFVDEVCNRRVAGRTEVRDWLAG